MGGGGGGPYAAQAGVVSVAFIAGQAWAHTAVRFRLLHPFIERLRRAPEHRRKRLDRRQQRRVIFSMLTHHPHRLPTQLGGAMRSWDLDAYSSILSQTGASGKLGAVQTPPTPEITLPAQFVAAVEQVL